MSIDVGNRLRTIRQLHGLSQRELARRAGVTNGLISLVEMNRVSPSVGSLKKLLDGIPMSLAEFFTGDFNQRTPVFYGADELVEIGNEDVSLQAGRRATRGTADDAAARTLCTRERPRARRCSSIAARKAASSCAGRSR